MTISANVSLSRLVEQGHTKTHQLMCDHNVIINDVYSVVILSECDCSSHKVETKWYLVRQNGCQVCRPSDGTHVLHCETLSSIPGAAYLSPLRPLKQYKKHKSGLYLIYLL